MKLVSSTELILELAVAGYGGGNSGIFDVVDRQYALMTEDFLTGEFSKSLWSLQNFFETKQWIAESNDCDDFARAAAFLAQTLHHRTPNKPKDSGIAFGELWYVRDAGDAHAIDIVKTENGYKEYEPQTRSIVKLSATERANTFKIRF